MSGACRRPLASCDAPCIQRCSGGLAGVQPTETGGQGPGHVAGEKPRGASDALHHGPTSPATGFLPPLSFLLFFPGVCITGSRSHTCFSGKAPDNVPPDLSHPASTAGGMRASQGARTVCPWPRHPLRATTRAMGRWWVLASPGMAAHGVPGATYPCLGMGRGEARKDPL